MDRQSPQKYQIVNAPETNLAETYKLIADIYGESTSFCDTFEQKYPSIDSYADFLSRDKNLSLKLFALHQGSPVGFLFLSPQKPLYLQHTAYFSMGIRLSHQGQGLGKALVQQMLQQRPQQTEIIYLMVREDNSSAIKLYQNFDFNTAATLEKDTKIGDHYYDGRLMRKSFILPS